MLFVVEWKIASTDGLELNTSSLHTIVSTHLKIKENKVTYSPPVLGNVLNLGNDPSISKRANSLGKSALSSAAALAGCTSSESKSSTVSWPAASPS
jgi:hypothetical protein